MAGGTFDKTVGKVRPGTYVNFQSSATEKIHGASRGICLLPLANAGYGPAGEFLSITGAAPDAYRAKLGYSIYEDDEAGNMLLIREALKNAETVLVYGLSEGEKARAEIVMTLVEEEAEEESELQAAVDAIIAANLGVKENLTGCRLNVSGTALLVTLTGTASEVKNTGIFDTLAALLGAGYTVTLDGTEITSVTDVQQTEFYAKVVALAQGDADISGSVFITDTDGEKVEYAVAVSYPEESDTAGTIENNESGNTAILTAIARYGGSRGNALVVTIDANPLSGYDVLIHLDGNKVAVYEGLKTVEELIEKDDPYILFVGTGALGENAGTSLEQGTDGTSSNADVSAFLDAADGVKFHTMAFPFEDSTLQTACKTKIKYMRENEGKKVQAVVANMTKPDYEGIINVTNSYALDDRELTAVQATAFVAGMTAGATYTESSTYRAVDGAVAVVGSKSHEEAVAAIQAGEFFFSRSEQGEIVVEYDINSLLSWTDGKDETYRKNRVIRVLDAFHDSLLEYFPPNKYDNNAVGWDIMEGIGKSILKLYYEAGAIDEVDYDSDFLVDRENSADDKTYFDVGIKPVDSAEKLFFTVTTR